MTPEPLDRAEFPPRPQASPPQGNTGLIIVAWLLVISTCCLWTPFAGLAIFAGSMDNDRPHSPPVSVLPSAAGLDVTAAGGSYGSGLADVRSSEPVDRRLIVEELMGALRSDGWELNTNAQGETTAVSPQSVTAKFSYTGDRFDWETQGFAIDVAAKKERIVRVDLSYPNDGVGWNDTIDARPVIAVTVLLFAAMAGLLVSLQLRKRRGNASRLTETNPDVSDAL